MNNLNPRFKRTEHRNKYREWFPASFDQFVLEADHIASALEGKGRVALFRGHANVEWFLDSTFLRYAINHLFEIPIHTELNDEIRHSQLFHRAVASLVLLKFGPICRPSPQAFEAEKRDGIDPWYEWLKRIQQYPEEDMRILRGSFFIDFTMNLDVALYFSVFEGRGDERRISSGHGALWIYDPQSTQNFYDGKVIDILNLMQGDDFINGVKTFPLIFHPPRQTPQKRAINQQPVYVAQMDYRYDLAELLNSYGNEKAERVFTKLILHKDFKKKAAYYLEERGITEAFVYPE